MKWLERIVGKAMEVARTLVAYEVEGLVSRLYQPVHLFSVVEE